MSPKIEDAIPIAGPGARVGIGRRQAVTSAGTQRDGGGSGSGGHRRRAGLRLRLTAIPGLTPKAILRSPLYLPVVLGPDFEVQEEALHSDFETVGAGQFSSPAGGKHAPQLKNLDFETLSLTWDAKWLVFPDTTPEEVREELQAILSSRKPVELFAYVGPNGKGSEIRMMATLRSFRRILRHGENDTRYFSLEWKQYRDLGVARKGANAYAGLPTTHTLDKEDTLRSIADHYYGTEAMWQFLASQNGIKSWGGDDPLVKMDRYKVGSKIKVPVPPPTKVGSAKALTGDDNHLRVGGG
jgi:hypothetical protein